VAAVCLGEIGQVIQVWDDGVGVPMARVRIDDREVAASLLCLPEAREGAVVLVQLGYAVEELDPARAAAALALRKEPHNPDDKEDPA